jgi:glucan-binding YG repeat protein
VKRFIVEFKRLSPLPLGIYSYTSFIGYIEDAKDDIKDMPFWEANYNNNPWNLPDNDIFSNRIGHQYTETGSINGVSEKCDVNSFTQGVSLNNETIAGEWIHNSDKNKWWYKHNDGSYTKDGWEKIKDKWYLFDSDGWMLYDWKLSGDYWYYLGASDDGSMKTGWLLKDSKWYYLADNGQMLLSWQKIKDNWYYFNQNGEMVTGWFKDNGHDYLTYSTGELITNIDIYGYHFDKDGHATKL